MGPSVGATLRAPPGPRARRSRPAGGCSPGSARTIAGVPSRTRLDTVLLVVAAGQAFFAVLLLIRPQFVLDLWPFPGTTELTFIFLASIFAAAGASTAWAALVGDEASYAGIALDYLAIFGPMLVYLLFMEPARGGGLTVFWLALLATATFGAWLLWRTVRLACRDPRPTPRPALAVFAIFAVVLALVGGALVLNVPDVLPWPVTPELSVIAGLIFLGAAVYFIYALLRPGWSNAGGQLAGFLAYDVVLVLPFLARLGSVPDTRRLSLSVYTAVIIGSGVLAAWYLFFAARTRGSQRPR